MEGQYGPGLNGDHRFQSGYGYDTNSRGLYGQGGHGGRYGMMSGGGRGLGHDGKLNGFHGGKHGKRGDMDRECSSPSVFLLALAHWVSRQPLCRKPIGGPYWRNSHDVQGPTWLPVPTEETGRGYPRPSRHHFP